ncbi:MAG: amidohydrolase family protein [Gemmatimonadota bacterium]|nr:amidohydrolase family protein [Gemmatimonadota bacterium]
MESLELGLVLLGTTATAYFAWPHLKGALRFVTGRWALALMVPCLAGALGAGYVIDLAKAGDHPERIGSAQLVMTIGMLGFLFAMVVIVVLAVHESYGGSGPDRKTRQRSDQPRVPPADPGPRALPESGLPKQDATTVGSGKVGDHARRLLILLGAVLIPASRPIPLAAQSPATFSDAHVHLNDPAAWIRMMDTSGIDRAIIFRGRDIDNAGLLAAARRWPGRLIPFLSISPEHQEYRARWAAEDMSLVAEADSMLAAGGFFGIGELSVSHFPGAGFPEADFDPDGRVMRGLMEVARRRGVPVTMHVEVTRLREFEALLAAFPDVTVIWAHGGYTPVFLAERLLAGYPNLIYELSARTWPEHPRSADYTILRNGVDVWPQWLALVERMPRRFIVGTDASLRSVDSDRDKITSVLGFLAQLSPATRDLVARRNLELILRRDR